MNNLITEAPQDGGVAAASASSVSPSPVSNPAQQNRAQVGMPCAAIELRVTRAGTVARRLRINASRCTLGSGEGCTVRLSDTTLRPLHAVILQEDGRILIRGYTVPIEINGELSIESYLAPGDVFRLGQYCFEMINPPLAAGRGETARTRAAAAGASRGATTPRPDLLGQTDEDDTEGEPGKRLRFAGASDPGDIAHAIGGGSPRGGAASALPGLIAAQLHAKRNSELLSELNAVRLSERGLRDQLNEALGRYEHSQQQAVQASHAVSELQGRIAALTEQLQTLATEAESHRQRSGDDQAQLREAITASQEAQAARDSAQRAQADALRNCDAAYRQRDEAYSQRDEAYSQRDEAYSQRDEAYIQRDEACAQRDTALSQRDTAIAQRAEALAQRSAAIDAEQAVQAQMREANQQIQQLTQQCEQASQLLAQAQQEVAAGRAEIDRLEAQYHLQADTMAREGRWHADTVSQKTAIIEQLGEEIRQLQQELDRRQQATDSGQEQQLSALRQDLDATLQQHLAEKASWADQTEQLQQAIQQLTDELAGATSRLSKSESRYDAVQRELTDVRDLLATTQSEASGRPSLQQWDELREQLRETETRLAETETQLRSLQQDYDRLREGYHQAPETSSAELQESDAAPISPAWPAFDAPAPQETPQAAQSSEPSLLDQPSSLYSATRDTPPWQKTTGEQDEPAAYEDSQWPATDRTVTMPEARGEDSQTGVNWFAAAAQGTATEQTDGSKERLLEQDATQCDPSLSRLSALDRLEPSDARNEAQDRSEAAWQRPSSSYESSNSYESDTYESDSPYEPKGAYQASGTDESSSDYESSDAYQSSDAYNSGNAYEPGTYSRLADDDAPSSREPRGFGAAEEPIDDAVEQSGLGSVARMLFEQLEASESADPLDQQSQFEDDEESSQQAQQRRQRASDERALRDSLAGGSELSEEDAESDQSDLSHTDRRSFETASSARAIVDDSDEDSVEAYMSRLLQRMGHAPAPAPNETQSKPRSESVSWPRSSDSQRLTDAKSKAPADEERHDPNVPLAPRSQAPERQLHLDAMRQLANETAHSAISVSNEGQARAMKSQAMVNLMQASVVLICSAVFFYCGQKNPNLQWVWNTAGLLAGGLAMFFLYDMAYKLVTAIRTSRVAPASAAADEDDKS